MSRKTAILLYRSVYNLGTVKNIITPLLQFVGGVILYETVLIPSAKRPLSVLDRRDGRDDYRIDEGRVGLAMSSEDERILRPNHGTKDSERPAVSNSGGGQGCRWETPLSQYRTCGSGTSESKSKQGMGPLLALFTLRLLILFLLPAFVAAFVAAFVGPSATPLNRDASCVQRSNAARPGDVQASRRRRS